MKRITFFSVRCSYEYLSGEVEAWHIAPDCKELLDNQARFIRGRVTGIDLNAQTVSLADHKELSTSFWFFRRER